MKEVRDREIDMLGVTHPSRTQIYFNVQMPEFVVNRNILIEDEMSQLFVTHM